MKRKWIPVTTPPDSRRDVVAWGADEALYIAEYVYDRRSKKGFWKVYDYDVVVTHWMDVGSPEQEQP